MNARQFDVFSNSDPESADAYPYFIVLQNDAIGDLNTRIVAPLVSPERLPLFDRLMPGVPATGSHYLVDVTTVGTVPTRVLEYRVANVDEAGYQIVAALDLVLTGISS
jgi:toxin CcdB